MEKKPKKAQAKTAASSEPKLSQEITFEAFFTKCVTSGKLKPWQRDEIAAFFKDMRLREKEDFTVYEAMLERY